MRDELAGGALVGLASFQFGGVVVLGKVASDRGLPVPTMLTVRFAVAALVLLAVLGVLRRPARAARGEGGKLLLLGAVGYAGEAALFFLAVERGSASTATLLFFTYPVSVTLLAWALGRGRPTLGLTAALAASVGGAALVISGAQGLSISAAGAALAVGSGLAYTIYLTVLESTLRETPPLAGSLWVAASASAALAAASLAGGATRWPSGAVEWWAVGGMGAFTAGAFLTLFAGLRRLGVVRTAVIAALEPVATALLAAIFLHERLRATTAIGAAFILAGAAGAGLGRRARADADAYVP